MKISVTNRCAMQFCNSLKNFKAYDVPNWQDKKPGYVQDVGYDCTNTIGVNLINKP